MTDEQLASLRQAIKGSLARIQKFQDRAIGEENTKASLIEPILASLGWDIRDPDEVHREFKPTSRDCPVDFALKLMRPDAVFNPGRIARFFREAKAAGRLRHRCIIEIYDLKHIEQITNKPINPNTNASGLSLSRKGEAA